MNKKDKKDIIKKNKEKEIQYIEGSEPLAKIKRENYCRYFVLWDKNTYWNQTMSYIYSYKTYIFDLNENRKLEEIIELKNTVRIKAAASNLMKKTEVIQRINYLMDKNWLNDQVVDAHLWYCINQFNDLWIKIRWIQEYNKLKWRITDKLDIDIHNWEANPLEERIKKIKSKQSSKN